MSPVHSKHTWEIDGPKQEALSADISKELEYQYRLPESLISISIKNIIEFLTLHGIEARAEMVVQLGKNLEATLLHSDNDDAATITDLFTAFLTHLLDEYPWISSDSKESYCNRFRNLIEEYILSANKKYYSAANRKKMLLMPESHFENGHYLHSNQYYFAKRYFQNAENCDKLALLLANKISALKLKNITLVGLRSYSGMLLNKTKILFARTGRKIDYIIIEPLDNNNFTWEFIPNFETLNTNFLIVLPITSTCSTYIRVRKYLQRQITDFLAVEFPKSKRRVKEDWIVRKDFINIFLIQDSRLKGLDGEITLNKKSLAKLTEREKRDASPAEISLSNLYSDFNWEMIKDGAIYFRHDQFPENGYIAHPIVKLYADLSVPEDCASCFPLGDPKQERNMFLTHDNFETPNLIQDFPDFGKRRSTDFLLKAHKQHLERTDLTFTRLFPTDGNKRPSHHYGHIMVNGSSFLNYIRGNTFFADNKEDILSFFDGVLAEILSSPRRLEIDSIVFITPETKHNSTFLDEINDYKHSKGKGAIANWKNRGERYNHHYQTYTLRFDPKSEFIDNFMSSYIDLIKGERALIIYYEEVFSAGKNFKLLSNFIKHYKNIDHEQKELQHGFDFVLSLIDRTAYHTKEEILKELYSRKVDDPVNNRFIPFFQLNAPIIEAAHLGDPLSKHVHLLQQMVNDSYLDFLKKRIGGELKNKVATKLPEENILYPHDLALRYFLFEEEDGKVTKLLFEKYKGIFNSGKFELLKLYVTHITNAILSDNRKEHGKSNLEILADNGELITHIVNQIAVHIEKSKEAFFSIEANSESNVITPGEKQLISDTVLKILSRHPFTYYTKIYESIFKYCLAKLEELRLQLIDNKGIPSFAQIRKLKFYTRRLVDLDSSYLISKEFLSLIKHLYEFRLANNRNRISSLMYQLNENIKQEILEHLVDPLNALSSTLVQEAYGTPRFEEQKKRLWFYLFRLTILGKLHLIKDQDLQLIVSFIKLKSGIPVNPDEDMHNIILNFLQDTKNKQVGEAEFFEDVVINNAIYKYNTINSFATYLMYLFKESVFKNHFRSIKLEGLINKGNYLPELISAVNPATGTALVKQLQDPYFHFTGGVNAENLYLFRRLKELHITKYLLFLERRNETSSATRQLEEKWMDPYSTEQICHYYFESWKSDPIIVNANKFLLRSRHQGTEHFRDIKTSLANMLKASTILINKDESRRNEDFISNIHEVMKAIVSILQPGMEAPEIPIGSPGSKLGYALCIKYSNKPPVSSASENVYVISSDRSTTGAQISTNGLIYNLMNGLFASVKKSGMKLKDDLGEYGLPSDEQSLLTGVKVNGKWTSFNEHYFHYAKNDTNGVRRIGKYSFDQLMETDCLGNDGKSGLPLLARSGTVLFFRLSELDEAKFQKGSCLLEGKAVLVITCLEVNDRDELLKFMSNEKVRLLLLIRQELLHYLKSITSNNTFYQLMKNNELLNYQSTLKHGLEDYFVYQDKILEANNFEARNLIILKSLNDAIKGQISAYDLTKNTPGKAYEVSAIKERLTQILESPLIMGKSVSGFNYKINFDGGREIEMDSFIFDIILLELLINAKRHSPNVGAGIEIHFTKDGFSIKNMKKTTNVSDTQRHRQGLELCHRVCTFLPYELSVQSTDTTFEVTILKK